MVEWGGTLEKEFRLILDEVARVHGFCDWSYSSPWFHDRDTVTAWEFADFVLIAEGMDPAYETEWRRTLAQAFSERFGRNSIAVSDYPASSDKK
jgi:hypothetical protein